MPLAASTECRRGKLQKPLDLLQQRTPVPSKEPRLLAALLYLLSPEYCFLPPSICRSRKQEREKLRKKKISSESISFQQHFQSLQRKSAKHSTLLLAGGTLKTVCSHLLTLILASPFCLITTFRAASSWACHSSSQLRSSQGLHSSPGPAAICCISLERPLRKY